VPNDDDLKGYNRIFGKYVYVWMWSLLLGTATSIGFSFISYRTERWGPLGLSLVLLQILGGICVLLCLSKLLRFFGGFLLPIFFGDVEITPEERVRAGRLLGMSFRYIIYAVGFRFLLSAIEVALTLSSHAF
jgi:hypothetical protein